MNPHYSGLQHGRGQRIHATAGYLRQTHNRQLLSKGYFQNPGREQCRTGTPKKTRIPGTTERASANQSRGDMPANETQEPRLLPIRGPVTVLATRTKQTRSMNPRLGCKKPCIALPRRSNIAWRVKKFSESGDRTRLLYPKCKQSLSQLICFSCIERRHRQPQVTTIAPNHLHCRLYRNWIGRKPQHFTAKCE